MKQQTMLILGVIVIGALFFMNQPADNGGGSSTPDSTGQCAFQPTATLTGQDKYDTTVAVSASHLYHLNGGATQTYSAAFNVQKGDSLEVLWGNGNATLYNFIQTYTMDCGLNQVSYKGLVQNASVTVECFDEASVLYSATTGNNYTIGSGEAAAIPCRFKMNTNNRGIPHGAVMVAELATGTVYKEENTDVNGDYIGGETSVPGAYSLAAAANKAVAWEINPLLDDTGYQDFTLYVEADNGQDPGTSNDIIISVYSKDCYENSDSGEFECGVETEDNAWAGDMLGTLTLGID